MIPARVEVMQPASSLSTVAIISYNYGRFLRQAVDSVLSQSRRPHVLIADDASEDETWQIVDELRQKQPGTIDYYRSGRNRGLAHMRNTAARLATTEWIIYLDGDDWLAPSFIESGETWLASHARTDVLTTDMVIVRDRQRRFSVEARAPRCWTDLADRNTVVATSFIRRALVSAVGGYDETLHFEDWDFWIRALKAGYRIERLPGVHVFRREHGLNKSKICDEEEALRQIRAKHPLG